MEKEEPDALEMGEEEAQAAQEEDEEESRRALNGRRKSFKFIS